MHKKKLSIYIFGPGKMATIILPTLHLNMCDIISFVDKRPDTWNTQCMSRPIIAPHDMHSEQCDYLLIICTGAKDVAKWMTEEHAFPKDKIVPMDILEMNNNSFKIIKEIGQEQLSDALKMYLSCFPRLFEIVDMDVITSHAMLRAWLTIQWHMYTFPPRSKVRYCNYLLEGLNFGPDKIYPCCETRSKLMPCEIDECGTFEIVAYRDRVNDIIKELQFDTYLCEECSYLIETDKSLAELYVEKFNFKIIVFNHNHSCNCKCIYCPNLHTQAKTQPHPIFETIKKIDSAGLLNKNCIFHWGGGEPTILKEFEETASWLASQGYFQQVFTSGIKMSPAIMSMLEAGICEVVISLDSGSRAMYKKIKIVDEWEKVIKTCATY